MADSTLTSLPNYHKNRKRQGGHTAEWHVDTLYAYQIGVVSAARAANGVSNVWQGVDVIPLANADEVHILWIPPHHINWAAPLKVRFIFFSNNASGGSTMTLTYDKVTWGEAGDAAVAADGATALTTTLAAITDAATTANYPIASVWGEINGSTTNFDALFFKGVSSSNSGADRLRVVAFQVAYKSLIF